MKPLLLMLTLAMLLAACGGQDFGPPGVGATATPRPTPTLAPTPTQDRLGWLDDRIAAFEAEPVANPPRRVVEYELDGAAVYLVTAPCCDIFTDLYDADGQLIGHPSGGIAGGGDGRPPGFFERAREVGTYWEDTRGPEERTSVLAPIVDLRVDVAESFPPQYFLHIVSALPNGCHRFDRWELAKGDEAADVVVRVYNTVPADLNVACAQVYGTHETTVPLGSDFESGVTYEIAVNDAVVSFTAQ